MIIIIFIAVYLAFQLPHLLAPLYTGFVLPKSLWILVPFRVVGWRCPFNRHKIYRNNWMWSKDDYDNFYMEEKDGLEATIKAEISKLHTLRYVKDGNGYKAVLRDVSLDPHIDQVVENIITIYARYHLKQGE